MSAVTVWELPCLSQEREQRPRIRHDGFDGLVIAYDFYLEDGSSAWEEMIFDGVAGFRFTLAGHCSVDQIQALDKLQEVVGSEWVASVEDRPPGLRHYRIYFDDVGCYEVLATTFVPPPVGPPRG